MKTRIVLTLMLALLGFKTAAADTQTDREHFVMPLVSMESVPLPDAIKNLARQAGINYIIDPTVLDSLKVTDGHFVHDPWITTKWKNMTARQIMDDLFRTYNLKLTTNPVTTVARITLASQNIEPVPASQLGRDINQPLPMIKMEDVPLRDAITNLAHEAKLSVKFHLMPPEKDSESQNPLNADVNLRWENLTAKQALVALLDNYGLLMVQYPDSATVHIIANRQPAQ